MRAALDRIFVRAHDGLAPCESAAWIVRERGGDVAVWALVGVLFVATALAALL